MYLCVRVSNLTLTTILVFDFGTVPDCVGFFSCYSKIAVSTCNGGKDYHNHSLYNKGRS